MGPEGQVCAFKPDGVAFARLRRHVKMNRLDNVKLFQVAASDHDGDLEMIVSGGLASTVTYADGRICRWDEPPESTGIIFTC